VDEALWVQKLRENRLVQPGALLLPGQGNRMVATDRDRKLRRLHNDSAHKHEGKAAARRKLREYARNTSRGRPQAAAKTITTAEIGCVTVVLIENNMRFGWCKDFLIGGSPRATKTS
jgi:hypothetical protein